MVAFFSFARDLRKCQDLARSGKFRFFDPQGRRVLFGELKMFNLREHLRVYWDETRMPLKAARVNPR